jgi:hypothetical protein
MQKSPAVASGAPRLAGMVQRLGRVVAAVPALCSLSGDPRVNVTGVCPPFQPVDELQPAAQIILIPHDRRFLGRELIDHDLLHQIEIAKLGRGGFRVFGYDLPHFSMSSRLGTAGRSDTSPS